VLRVESSANSTQINLMTTSAGGSNWLLMSTANGSSIGGGKFSVYGNSQHRFVLDKNGNVGIGISSPVLRLEVAGGDIGLDNGEFLRGKDDGGTHQALIGVLSGDNVNVGSTNFDDITFDVGGVNDAVVFQATTGNVGIGTTSPGYTFEVEKSNAINNTEYLLGAFNHSGNGGGVYMGYVGDGTDAKEGRVRSGGNIPLTLGTTAFKQAIYISNGNGNVGIGTTSPDNKLEVNGTIRSKEIKVEATGWPDYVFSENYELTPLSEIKSYVKENHHLPEVPSADQVAADGINLGEMNAMLLKKIEELTLHLIEMKEDIEKLKSQIK